MRARRADQPAPPGRAPRTIVGSTGSWTPSDASSSLRIDLSPRRGRRSRTAGRAPRGCGRPGIVHRRHHHRAAEVDDQRVRAVEVLAGEVDEPVAEGPGAARPIIPPFRWPPAVMPQYGAGWDCDLRHLPARRARSRRRRPRPGRSVLSWLSTIAPTSLTRPAPAKEPGSQRPTSGPLGVGDRGRAAEIHDLERLAHDAPRRARPRAPPCRRRPRRDTQEVQAGIVRASPGSPWTPQTSAPSRRISV